MKLIFALAGRMTARDWRAGELRFLLLALVVAVASLSSVGFFVDRMRAGLTRDAHQALAADLLIASTSPIPEKWRTQAQARGLQTAQTVVFPSMGQVAAGNDSRAKLVTIKAVSAAYPLRGAMKLYQGKSEVAVREVPAAGTAWVDPALLGSLGIQIGSEIQLGELKLKVTQSIALEPDRGAGFLGFSPRVMISLNDLAATQLIQDGSRATYRLLLAGDAEQVKAMKTQIAQEIEVGDLRGVRLETIENGNEQLQNTLNRAEQFLSMVSMLSALLAALAIAMAARRFMLRHIDACAMLRCLGLTQNQLTALYSLEFLILGVIGSVLGVTLGYAAHYVLLHFLAQFVSHDLPVASLLPAYQGFALGILLLIGFALPPILQLRDVPHNRVIRREQDPPKAMSLLTYGVGSMMFLALMLWQSGDVKLGLTVSVGFFVCLMLFAVVARLSLWVLQKTRSGIDSSVWRFAITALQRRQSATVMQVVALSLGLMALLLLTIVRSDLMSSWKQATPPDAPNHFVINIQNDQKQKIADMLSEFGAPPMYPMIRGRLVRINDEVVKPENYKEEQLKSLVTREFNLSTMADLPESNTVIAGQWYQDHSADKAEVSMEEGLVKNLKLKLGDRLRFEIAGQALDTTLTSIRKLEWGSMRVNFFAVINPKAMQNKPQTWITAVHLPEQRKQFSNQLTQLFPNLTVMDVSAIIKQLQGVLDQVMSAVEFLFLFMLVSGLMVLYAVLMGSQDERMREAALLRALGATKSQLSQAQWMEFLLIGSLSGLLAASGASAIGWVLATYSFKFAWLFSPTVLIVGWIAGAACAVGGAWLGLRQILNHAPLHSLRHT